jgi:hypothetical protein
MGGESRMLEGGLSNLEAKLCASRGKSMDSGTRWREDLRVGFTIFGVLLLMSVLAALGVKLLLGH